MSSITEQIFNDLYEKLISTGKLTDSLAKDFFGLFGEEFIDVLPLLKCQNIIKIQSPSDRFLLKVKNSSKVNKHSLTKLLDYNYSFVMGNYCNCIQFTLNCVNCDKLFWCKHLIASKIALAIGCFNTILVEEEDFQNICRHNILNIN